MDTRKCGAHLTLHLHKQCIHISDMAYILNNSVDCDTYFSNCVGKSSEGQLFLLYTGQVGAA